MYFYLYQVRNNGQFDYSTYRYHQMSCRNAYVAQRFPWQFRFQDVCGGGEKRRRAEKIVERETEKGEYEKGERHTDWDQ